MTFAVPGSTARPASGCSSTSGGIDAGIVRVDVDLVRRSVRCGSSRTACRCARSPNCLAASATRRARRRAPAATARRSGGALYLQIGLAGFAFGNVMLFSIPRYANGAPLEPPFQRLFDALNLALATPVLLFSASDYFAAAWRALARARLTLDVPVALGLPALFGRSLTDIADRPWRGVHGLVRRPGVLPAVGRLFQHKPSMRIAFDRTFRSFLPLSVRVEHGTAAAVAHRVAAGRPSSRCGRSEVVPADAVLLDDAGRSTTRS